MTLLTIHIIHFTLTMKTTYNAFKKEYYHREINSEMLCFQFFVTEN